MMTIQASLAALIVAALSELCLFLTDESETLSGQKDGDYQCRK